MSPPHFRFYDEAPGRALLIEQVPLSNHVVPVFRNNVYWSTDSGAQSASIFPDEKNWVEWQESGNDTGSVWSQPLFRWNMTDISVAFTKCILSLNRDPAMKDYTLAANSPAWAIGFEEIDVAAIGPGGDVTST